MAKGNAATTAGRYLNLVRRGIEVTVVLFLAFITTIFTACFGWIALLFKPSSGAKGVPVSGVAFSTVKASKEF